MQRITEGIQLTPLWCLLLMMISAPALSETLVPPDDPTQSINYWKPNVIAAEDDEDVAQAQRVFSNLLRSWDSSRIEPSLFVVESAAGPWAASLMDGNILLSRAAIEACQAQGKERSEHLLAFVLAHELAHQKADDLWHQKFFRLSGNQTPKLQRQLLKGLNLDQDSIADLERREARADHDGLVMMATVGYDPFYITDQRDFFTAWVENVWQESCVGDHGDSIVASACEHAKTRAMRTRTQLVAVANQTTLFELGLQAFVAGRWEQARKLFIGFGRDYPSRAVHTNIGLIYLAQAVDLLASNDELHPVPGFYFPLMLDSNPEARPVGTATPANKRGSPALIKQQLHKYLAEAAAYFEKAIRLEPTARDAYLFLAMSHLLDNNTFMVRGILQGKFVPQFGPDLSVDLLLALTSAFEGKDKQTTKQFQALISQLERTSSLNTVMPQQVVTYSAHYNYAVYLTAQGQTDAAKKLWQDLAKKSQKSGNSLIFRLALSHLNSTAGVDGSSECANVRNLKIGDRPDFARLNKESSQQTSFWHEGEQFNIYRFNDGARLVLGPEQQLIAAWQHGGQARLDQGVTIGDSADRPLKAFGIPSRRIYSIKGEYLAYDGLGLAVHIIDNKVAGWFLYQDV